MWSSPRKRHTPSISGSSHSRVVIIVVIIFKDRGIRSVPQGHCVPIAEVNKHNLSRCEKDML